MRRLLYAYVGRKYADKVSEVASLTNQTFSSFISGQCVEAVILGVMFFLVMSILRLPYSLVISVFIAFMALIPYVGAFLGCVVGMRSLSSSVPCRPWCSSSPSWCCSSWRGGS